MDENYYAVIACKLVDFNKNISLADPNRSDYFVEAKKGVAITVFSHEGDVMIALGFRKSQFVQS